MSSRTGFARLRGWLRKLTAPADEGASGPLAELSGEGPGGAGSSSSETMVEVLPSSNTASLCSPLGYSAPIAAGPGPAPPPPPAPAATRPAPAAPLQEQQMEQTGAAQQSQAPQAAAPLRPVMPDTRDFFSDCGEANRYAVREVIGKGSYGVVCSAVDQFTGERVAIKKITNVFEHVSDATRILREIKLLRMLKHPDVVEIKHIMLPPSPRDFKDIYVVFELMETDLHQVIKANDDLTPEHHQFFLYQMLRGLKYIHSAKVFHRDLKPKNILANADCKLKICDFGLARPAFNDVPQAIMWTDYVATRWYRAPELCGSFYSKYSPAIDIWSVGCIFAEVLLGKPLFPGKNVAHQLEIITDLLGTPAPHVLEKVRNEKARRFLQSMRPKPGIPFNAFFPRAAPGALALLRRLLAFDPSERPSAEEALADPYFAGLHSPAREPIAQPISKVAFEFDRRKLEMSDVRDLIYREILEYHPQVLRQNLGHGMRSAYVNPSGLDNFKRQFMHLQQNPGAVLGESRAVPSHSHAPNHAGHSGAAAHTSDASAPRSTAAVGMEAYHAHVHGSAAQTANRAAARDAAGDMGHAHGHAHSHALGHNAAVAVAAAAAAHSQAQHAAAAAVAAVQQQQQQQMLIAGSYGLAAAPGHAAAVALQGAYVMYPTVAPAPAPQPALAFAAQAWVPGGAPPQRLASWGVGQSAAAAGNHGRHDRSSAHVPHTRERHLQAQISAPMPAMPGDFLQYPSAMTGGLQQDPIAGGAGRGRGAPAPVSHHHAPGGSGVAAMAVDDDMAGPASEASGPAHGGSASSASSCATNRMGGGSCSVYMDGVTSGASSTMSAHHLGPPAHGHGHALGGGHHAAHHLTAAHGHHHPGLGARHGAAGVGVYDPYSGPVALGRNETSKATL